jgi:type II secretory pathway pseudopilin PulG
MAAGPSAFVTAMMQQRLSRGYSVLELIFAAGLATTLGSIAVPQMRSAVDDVRAAGAVRYLTSRLARARMEAAERSADVAFRFAEDADGEGFAVYVDGNGDGVQTLEIQQGIDQRLTPIEHLRDNFPGVAFEVPSGLPPVDSGAATDGDPLKLGASNLLSFSPSGTSSSGSVYVRGRSGAQYVVRAYGQTAKVRALKYDARSRRWSPL